MNLQCAILHLEDDDNDSVFFERALQTVGFSGTYRRVCAVGEVIAYLAGNGQYADRTSFPFPNLLVLDNVMAGSKLTAWLNDHRQCNSLPRIVLTGGIPDAEIEEWIRRGVRYVLQKGTSLEEMRVSVQRILQFRPQ
jgi:hypothetical protein